MPAFRLATFSAEITPPMGHPLMGGGIAPASEVVDPLLAKGIVLWGGADPVVLCALDWCEVRNDAYDAWRDALAEAAHTVRERVLLASVHQHDTPISDLTAERILEERGAAGRICDLKFHAEAVARVAAALREAMKSGRAVTRIGTGKAQVSEVSSNRRFALTDGSISFGRTSSTQDAAARAAEEGLIDPWLRTLSFWDSDACLAELHAYAVHPMSHYGKGGVSKDFVGHARERREAETPGVFQIYFSGASGNVTAGKYNDGAPENRARLADRMLAAMRAASESTERHSLERLDLRVVPLALPPRGGADFTHEGLTARLASRNPFQQCLAAMGLSWRKRSEAGQAIDLPALDFGPAKFVLLPGESYVEYQLAAQALAPESFVFTSGYGECAPGYIPTEKHFKENDSNLGDWCWVAPGCEAIMRDALANALKR